VEEMDAADLTADTLRRIMAESGLLGMGEKSGRAFIINEAHGLNANQVRKLLTVIEPGEIPAHVVWVFTTTVQGQAKLFEGIDDSGPLLSRCTVIELAQRDLAARFAERAREIAQLENLDGQPIERYARLVKDCNCNMRAVLQAIDAGEMIQ
jgi:replication-associated recombination protein RarA